MSITTMRLLASGLVLRKSTSAPTWSVVRVEPLVTSKKSPTLQPCRVASSGETAAQPGAHKELAVGSGVSLHGICIGANRSRPRIWR
jgi:hypothetical protein